MPILTEQLNTSSFLGRRGWKDFLGFIRLTLRCLNIVMKYMPLLDKMSHYEISVMFRREFFKV